MMIRRFGVLAGVLALGACAISDTGAPLVDDNEIVVTSAVETEPMVCEVDELVAADELDIGRRDAWVRVRDGFGLPVVDNDRVNAQLRWYASHPSYLGRVATPCAPHFPPL